MAPGSLKVELSLTKILIASSIKLGFIMYPILHPPVATNPHFLSKLYTWFWVFSVVKFQLNLNLLSSITREKNPHSYLQYTTLFFVFHLGSWKSPKFYCCDLRCWLEDWNSSDPTGQVLLSQAVTLVCLHTTTNIFWKELLRYLKFYIQEAVIKAKAQKHRWQDTSWALPASPQGTPQCQSYPYQACTLF